MAEITFTGNKQLKTIAREWSKKFPYLYLRFYNAEGKASEWTVTHGSIRGKKSTNELSTNAGMNVATFESRYEAAFGCKIEIMYQKGTRNYRSLGENNNQSLSEYNAWAKEKGAVEIMKAQPTWF